MGCVKILKTVSLLSTLTKTFILSKYAEYISVFFNDKLLFLSAIALMLSFISTFKLIPFIANISLDNNLMVKPNERSSHFKNIPQLGGLAITIPILIITFLLGSIVLSIGEFTYLMASIICLLILMAVGVKDDVMSLPPWVKLLTQVISSLFFMVITDIRIDNFYGIFGVYDLSLTTSYLYTTFVFVVIINSYNLIDGIDGLAGVLGVVIFSFFLYYSLEAKSVFELLMSSSLIGGLLAFLRFNFSNGRYKIFMGDVGSLVIGFLLAVMAVSTLSDGPQNNALSLSNMPVFILALFCLPFLDTLRVFVVRGLSGISPFLADRNHLHHQFLKYGLTHPQITFILIVYCLLVIASAFVFRNNIIHIHLMLTMLVSVLLLTLLVWFFSKLNKTNKKQSKSN